MIIACIGSRNIDDATTNLLIEVGEYLVSNGHEIRSGNAQGADQSFALGGNKINASKVTLCLPWKGFNKENLDAENKILLPDEKWKEPAAAHHPWWNALSYGAKQLITRNYGIVSCADRVLARPHPEANNTGGTWHAIRCAESLGIPVLDLNGKSFYEVVEWINKP
jgi:hypothetical protein